MREPPHPRRRLVEAKKLGGKVPQEKLVNVHSYGAAGRCCSGCGYVSVARAGPTPEHVVKSH